MAAVCCALVPAAALAGTLTVNVDPAAGSGCGLLIPSANQPQFYYACDGFGSEDVALGYFHGAATVPGGSRVAWQVNAPAGFAINSAYANVNAIGSVNDGEGWGGGDYYSGGSGGDQWYSGSTSETAGPFDSSYWGFQMLCGWSSCSNGGVIAINSIQLTATEDQGPSLDAVGSGNLWYQAGRYVWNPPADPWPISLAGSDPSGVCDMWAYVNGVTVQGPAAVPNTGGWQQCPDPTWSQTAGASVDTRDYVAGAGPLSLTLGASNAAGVASQPSETLQVDNDPVNVSLSTPDDPTPSQWVNHPVTVDAQATAGPSGIASLACSADGKAASAYPAGGVTITGTRVHTVSCTATNRAVDPQGQPNSATSTTTVKIDQTPPTVAFEPSDPAAPTQLVADVADAQSGVAGGSIQMRPVAGGPWQPLSTQFDGRHLIASFDDSGLTGAYEFKATACDQVANCASTDQQLTLPVRTQVVSAVSLARISHPLVAHRVRERVLVGWHYKTIRRHHRRVRVKVGGHHKTITVVRMREHCTRRRVRVSKHHWRDFRTCVAPRLVLVDQEHVAYGHASTVAGLLSTSQGVPLAGAPVQILAAVADGANFFAPVATATTNGQGGWSVALPPGPSRLIEASYAGTATTLPVTSATVTVTVPARVTIHIHPRSVAWGSQIHITGQVQGGYVPAGSQLLRLNVGIGLIGHIEGLPKIAPNGRFVIVWRFDQGAGVIHPWFAVATLSESEFPFSPNSSARETVTLGKATSSSSSVRRRRGGRHRGAHHRAQHHPSSDHQPARHRRAIRSHGGR